MIDHAYIVTTTTTCVCVCVCVRVCVRRVCTLRAAKMVEKIRTKKAYTKGFSHVCSISQAV